MNTVRQIKKTYRQRKTSLSERESKGESGNNKGKTGWDHIQNCCCKILLVSKTVAMKML